MMFRPIFDLFNPFWYIVPVFGFLQFLPAAFTAGKGILDYFGGKKKRDQDQAQRDLANQFITGREAANEQSFEDIMGGLKGAGQDPYAGFRSTMGQTGATSSTTRGREQIDSGRYTTKPYTEMEELARAKAMERLKTTEDVTQAEKIRAVTEANKAYEGVEAGMAAKLAGQGRGAMARAGAGEAIGASRASDIANLLGVELPDRARARNLENEDRAANLIATLGSRMSSDRKFDSTTRGTSDMTGWNQAAPNIQALMALQGLKGPIDPRVADSPMTPGWDAASGMAGAAAQLDWKKLFGGK